MASLGPAIVTGCVGLAAALLSFLIARISLKSQLEQNRDIRSHEELMLLVPHRIQAIETLWLQLYEIERGVTLEDARLAQIISAAMWLPPLLRDQFIDLLVVKIHDRPEIILQDEDFLALREGLLAAAHVSEIDDALSLRIRG
ncbi:hypothetical protein Snoj_55300 [Streptomyces nojiriensis]|uniref:Uncharacterized protein n=1 Tax=Streptomyces nojiriensis TaxID=66374 RepID=A0ABQ3SUJ3_9ACTN|nr:hypothetical protein [Streptomyces nojiriensis]GGR94126.1 hypothetical protein GCM10010205_23550 [Streptomyces nojiriensis]GHI71612.1 hypothetical protein Snoj_55300 [Streptomyces nojiriensis]